MVGSYVCDQDDFLDQQVELLPCHELLRCRKQATNLLEWLQGAAVRPSVSKHDLSFEGGLAWIYDHNPDGLLSLGIDPVKFATTATWLLQDRCGFETRLTKEAVASMIVDHWDESDIPPQLRRTVDLEADPPAEARRPETFESRAGSKQRVEPKRLSKPTCLAESVRTSGSGVNQNSAREQWAWLMEPSDEWSVFSQFWSLLGWETCERRDGTAIASHT